MDVQVRGSCNSGDEGEQGAENVEDQREDGVDGERLLDRYKSEVDKGEHAESGDEHVVVDDRGTAGDGEHVADESHAEEDPEELEASEGESDDGHVGLNWGCNLMLLVWSSACAVVDVSEKCGA